MRLNSISVRLCRPFNKLLKCTQSIFLVKRPSGLWRLKLKKTQYLIGKKKRDSPPPTYPTVCRFMHLVFWIIVQYIGSESNYSMPNHIYHLNTFVVRRYFSWSKVDKHTAYQTLSIHTSSDIIAKTHSFNLNINSYIIFF